MICELTSEVTTGENVAPTADACSLRLLESVVAAVERDRGTDASKSGKVERKATKSKEEEGGIESRGENLPELRTALSFLGLNFVKGSWELAVRD